MEWHIIGIMLVVCVVMSCQKGKTAKSENVAEEAVSKIMLSGEDSTLCMEVFDSYQNYEEWYADSAVEKAEMLMENASERYQQNKIHVDSVLNECMSLVGQRNYDQLIKTMEKERINFYSHPGNVIDNEIGLIMIFSKLYNQSCESQDSFYTKMLPIYRFTKLHMEALEALGKEKHPFYTHLLKVIEDAEAYVGETESW